MEISKQYFVEEPADAVHVSTDELFKIERKYTLLEVKQCGDHFYVLSESKAVNSSRLHLMTMEQARELYKWLGERVKELEQ